MTDLCNTKGKYVFDTNNEIFQHIYQDVVLLLEHRNFLFADDPELLGVKQKLKEIPSDVPIAQSPQVMDGIPITSEEMISSMQGANFPNMAMKDPAQPPMGDDTEYVRERIQFNFIQFIHSFIHLYY